MQSALIQQGKIGGYGLSNETAWGTTMFCRAAEQLGAPKPASIQNPYCLLNRSFEGDLAGSKVIASRFPCWLTACSAWAC